MSTETETIAPTHPFQAEVAELLNLMVHAVYSETDIFLRELISNASDACDKLRYEAIAKPDLLAGAALAIRITPDAKAGTLTVADNGIGMDGATVGNLRQQLLEPADSYGAGLGLRIVHRAIRAHGGRLQIDSHPGHGTTVHIDLPAAPPGAGVHDSGACEGEDPNSTGRQSNG
jgi:C4-dicarboxylate-specific signal transduction histidine kinase